MSRFLIALVAAFSLAVLSAMPVVAAATAPSCCKSACCGESHETPDTTAATTCPCPAACHVPASPTAPAVPTAGLLSHLPQAAVGFLLADESAAARFEAPPVPPPKG